MRRYLCRTLLVLSSCTLTAVSASALDTRRDEDVLHAALRQQVREHLDATERARGTVVCVGIDPGGAEQTPGRDFMARFARDTAVRRLAECERRAEGAVEIASSKPAVMVTAGPIEWIAEDEAWVAVSYFRTRRLSAERLYRVVREVSGWVSLGPIVKDIPFQQPPPRQR